MNPLRWIILVALSLNVVMCGNKGPLTLPEGEPRVPAASAMPFSTAP